MTVIGYDSFGSPLYDHQMAHCDYCRKPFESAAAAESCCSSWGGRGWD